MLDRAPVIEALRAAMEVSATSALTNLYGPESRIEVLMPAQRRSYRGAKAAAELFSRWWSSEAELPLWKVTTASHGFVLVAERRWSVEGQARATRHRHFVRLGDETIERHVILSERPQSVPIFSEAHVPSKVRALLERCVRRRGGSECNVRDPLAHSGMSGSTLERVVLDDGRPYIIKHVSPTTDWIMRATHDRGREAEMLASGALERIAEVVGTPVVEVEPHEDGWFIVMRDVAASLWGDQRTITAEEMRGLLAATRAMHERLRDIDLETVCSIEDRFRLLSAEIGASELSGPDLGPKMAQRSWELFPEVAPPDVEALVMKIIENPAPLANELRKSGTTLIHGDLKPDNVGRSSDGYLLLDWGLACAAPPAVELAWAALFAFRIEMTEDEIFDEFRRVWGTEHDERALALATIGQLAMTGPSYALTMVDDPDEGNRASATRTFHWWVDRARRALDVWAP